MTAREEEVSHIGLLGSSHLIRRRNRYYQNSAKMPPSRFLRRAAGLVACEPDETVRKFGNSCTWETLRRKVTRATLLLRPRHGRDQSSSSVLFANFSIAAQSPALTWMIIRGARLPPTVDASGTVATVGQVNVKALQRLLA